jgi:hypothetical protein
LIKRNLDGAQWYLDHPEASVTQASITTGASIKGILKALKKMGEIK